jgi:hypothetical protein
MRITASTGRRSVPTVSSAARRFFSGELYEGTQWNSQLKGLSSSILIAFLLYLDRPRPSILAAQSFIIFKRHPC